MARFDLYRGSGQIELYLDVQSEFHRFLRTRVVIPVMTEDKALTLPPQLKVSFTHEDIRYYAIIPMLGAIPLRMLGAHVGSLADQSHDIIAAIDYLLQGF